MHLFASLLPETRRLLDSVPALIDKTFPLPGRFRSALPANVAELSRLMTSARGERSLSYLGRPNVLSAYLRYFLPWNLYRLCRLLPGLDLNLAANETIIDLGCGPLTLTSALWISRPDLRDLPLEFRCIDHSGPALEAGKQFFAALVGSSCPWKLRTAREDIEHPASGEKPAALVSAVNVFNEAYGNLPHSDTEGLKRKARHAARILHSLASASGSILVVEPGVPHSGQFISLLRSALLGHKRPPASPCTHAASCPMPGGFSTHGNKRSKNRWCHFAFETEDAPKALRRLSIAAGIPKERAVLSFLLAGPISPEKTAGEKPPVRIISDSFSLPQNLCGRYGCCGQGLVLLTGEKLSVEKTASGALIDSALCENGQRDSKSGALLARYP
jgi:ribosomal protein RSM22 (predicted rRNA methylase)